MVRDVVRVRVDQKFLEVGWSPSIYVHTRGEDGPNKADAFGRCELAECGFRKTINVVKIS